MGECSRCGECCRWYPVAETKGKSFMTNEWLERRTDKVYNGVFLIDAPCKYLLKDGDRYKCGCYDIRPMICRLWNGQNKVRGIKVWIPKDCTMK